MLAVAIMRLHASDSGIQLVGTAPHKLHRQSPLQEFLDRLALDEQCVESSSSHQEKIAQWERIIVKIERFANSRERLTVTETYVLPAEKSRLQELIKSKK